MALRDMLARWIPAGPEQVAHAPVPAPGEGRYGPGVPDFDKMYVGLYGSKVTRGAGVIQYVDDTGEVQAIPQTQSSFVDWRSAYPQVSGEESRGGNAAALGLDPYLVDPPVDYEAEEAELDYQIHGPRGSTAVEGTSGTVNPANPGVPNLGPPNEQPFFTSQSQVVPHVQSQEQGWGLDPAIAVARFPHAEDKNPYYNIWNWRRNGQLPFSSEGIPFGRFTNQAVQAIEIERRNRSATHLRTVDNPPMMPFAETVPVEGQAGPIPMPMPSYDEAIY